MSCSSTETSSSGVGLSTIRGDSFGFLIRVWQDPDKTIPADLSEAVVRAQLRLTPDSEEIEATFATAIAGNEISFTLLPTETATLPQRSVWDVEIDWDGHGTSVQTIAHGSLTVGADVTR